MSEDLFYIVYDNYLYIYLYRYAAIDVLGFIFIYFYLPETEQRTLEDIELHFSDNNKKLKDIKIPKSKMVLSGKATSGGCDNNAFEGDSNKH